MSRDGRAMSAQEEADAEELRLRREFEELDIDGNGIVDKNEMNEFLRQRNIDEEHRMQIIDVIFQNTDADNNNVISLDEFVQHYVNTKNQLVSKEVQLISDIVEKNREIKDSKVQLQISLSRNRGKVSQYAGQLSVKVVRAEGLTGIRRSHVVIT